MQSAFAIPPWFNNPDVHPRRHRLLLGTFHAMLFWLLLMPCLVSVGLAGVAGLDIALWNVLFRWPSDWIRTTYLIVELPFCVVVTAIALSLLILLARALHRATFTWYSRVGDRLHVFTVGSITHPWKHLIVISLVVALTTAFLVYLFTIAFALIRDTQTPGGLLKVWSVMYLPGLTIITTIILLSLAYQQSRLAMQKLGAGISPSRLLRWSPPLLEPSDCRLTTIAHFTDLHLTSVDGAALYSTLPWCPKWPDVNRIFQALIAHRQAAIEAAEAVILTGDIVDTGSPEEWERVFGILPDAIRNKVIVVPGNHDVNIAGRSWFAIEDDISTRRKLRLIRWLIVADWLQGSRTQVLLTHDTAVTLREYLARVAPDLQRFASNPPRHKFAGVFGESTDVITDSATLAFMDLPTRVWKDAFPMVLRLPRSKCGVIVLDSNRGSSTMLTNGFGTFGDEQLSKLRRLLELLPKTPLILAMHHHLGLPPWICRRPEGVMNRALRVTDVDALLRVCAERGDMVVFNGHRHCHYVAEVRCERSGESERVLQIVSGASTTLGDEVTSAPAGFSTYTLAMSETGSVRIVDSVVYSD